LHLPAKRGLMDHLSVRRGARYDLGCGGAAVVAAEPAAGWRVSKAADRRPEISPFSRSPRMTQQQDPASDTAYPLLAGHLLEVFEQAPASVVVTRGPRHVFEYANAAYRQLLNGQALTGRPFADVLPEAAVRWFIERLDHCYASGETYKARAVPVDLRRPDGAMETHYFDFIYHPIRGRGGQVEGIIGQGLEVTERVLAEQALRRSEAMSKAMLGAALDSIITISADSRITEWNPAAERTFGYTRDEALGRDMAELIIPPEAREAHRRGMASFLASGHGRLVGRRVEVEALKRDGGRTPVELAINPIRLDGEVFFTAYLRDISARLKTEAALREGEERLRATYEHAFVGIAEVDRDGRILRANEQFSVITGFERTELVGKTIWDLTHADDIEAERANFGRHMAGNLDAYRLEKRYVQKSGAILWVELSASVVHDESGRPSYGVRVVRDISERKRWEDRQRLLINELNHRVKNTLATVQSIAAQTRRSVADPRDAYAAFVERLVALSGAHDALTQESWRGADLGAIVAGAVRPFGGEEAERFKIGGPRVWLTPQAAVALALAIHELATNAAKYGALTDPRGCVQIAWTLAEGENGPELALSWIEKGGPPVAPPRRKGFGSRLLERGLATELQGSVNLAFHPEGVVCSIRAPLEPNAEAPSVEP
jgi:PAS domain S-box-containing protein